MRWTKTKIVSLSVVAIIVLTAPVWLWMASNLAAGILSLMLEHEPTRAELIGDYTYKAPWGEAKLHLDTDGTFIEHISEGKDAAKEFTGSWTTEKGQNSTKVSFRPFGMVWDDMHGIETSIFAMNFYQRRSGMIYAKVDEDLGEQFEKH